MDGVEWGFSPKQLKPPKQPNFQDFSQKVASKCAIGEPAFPPKKDL